MYKSLISITVNLIENGVINRLVVNKRENIVSFNNNRIEVSNSRFNNWLSRFLSLIRKYGYSPDGIYDRSNIAAIEIVEQKKSYDFVVGGRALELLNNLITEIM